MAKTEDYSVLSVGQARAIIERSTENKERIAVAQKVVSQADIKGDADDYHNLAVVFTRDYDDYVNGFAIVEKGLKQYPNNIDLLADAVYYGSSAGEYEKCEQYAQYLQEQPNALWNWRAFTFLIDYYLAKPNWTSEDKEKYFEYTDKALDLAKMAQWVLSGDAEAERGYLAEYKVRMLRERYFRVDAFKRKKERDEENFEKLKECAEDEHRMAEECLESAIDSGKFAAVSCCLRLADSLFEQQNYKKTIEVCNRALCFVQSQPSARTGYFMYLLAMSEDALIHQEGAFGVEARIKVVYRDYVAAYQRSEGRNTYRSNIKDRLAILAAKSGVPAPSFEQENAKASRQLWESLGKDSN